MRSLWALAAVVGVGGSLGAAPPPAPAIDVLVPASNTTPSLSADQLAHLFTGSREAWNGGAVVAFNLPPRDPLRVEFDRVVLHMTPEEVGRYWIDQRIRGGARPPRQVEDSRLVPKLVARFPGGIGYVAAGMPTPADVRVVARLRDHEVIEP